MDNATAIRAELFRRGLIPSVDVESWELDFCIDDCEKDDVYHAGDWVAEEFDWQWDCDLRTWFEKLGMMK